MAALQLAEDVPDRLVAVLSQVGRLSVQRGPANVLRAEDGRSWPVALFPGIAPLAQATAHVLGHRRAEGEVPLVVAHRLLANVKEELERAGVSYADATGAAHVEAPGFLLHLEPTARGRSAAAVTAPRGWGAVGVRIVQVLLAARGEQWSVSGLAAAAGTSIGQAHNVLARLDTEGFLQSSGRPRLRSVTDPTDLLDWLGSLPAATKMHRRLSTYLYAPDPGGLVTRLAGRAHGAGTPWVLTGAAAAQVMGAPTVTSLPTILVRVDPETDLTETARQLRLEPVDDGGNVLLIADVGLVGMHASQHVGSAVVAPAVRIWLDLLTERRGDDAAAIFREGVLGY